MLRQDVVLETVIEDHDVIVGDRAANQRGHKKMLNEISVVGRRQKNLRNELSTKNAADYTGRFVCALPQVSWIKDIQAVSGGAQVRGLDPQMHGDVRIGGEGGRIFQPCRQVIGGRQNAPGDGIVVGVGQRQFQ